MDNGLIHIYCGDGKGKTTAAMGLAIRAAGRKKKVFITQFLKSGKSGELISLEKLDEYITFFPGKPVNKFVWNMNEEEKLLVEQNNIKYEELLFSYLNSYENTLLYTYVNIDDYNNNLACRLFLKNYYNLSGDNLDLEVLSPLYENIYEEVSNYLLLLESYPRE